MKLWRKKEASGFYILPDEMVERFVKIMEKIFVKKTPVFFMRYHRECICWLRLEDTTEF